MNHKCGHSEGEKVYLFGHEVDPCDYFQTERHENVTVLVSKCRRCGDVLVEWIRTPETVDYYYKEEKSE